MLLEGGLRLALGKRMDNTDKLACWTSFDSSFDFELTRRDSHVIWERLSGRIGRRGGLEFSVEAGTCEKRWIKTAVVVVLISVLTLAK